MLEDRIDGLTVAINRLSDILESRTGEANSVQSEEVSEQPKAQPKTKKKSPAKKKAAKPNVEGAKPSTPALVDTPKDESAAEYTLDNLISDLGHISQKLGARSTELSDLLMSRYHVSRVSELPKDKYVEFANACRAISA